MEHDAEPTVTFTVLPAPDEPTSELYRLMQPQWRPSQLREALNAAYGTGGPDGGGPGGRDGIADLTRVDPNPGSAPLAEADALLPGSVTPMKRAGFWARDSPRDGGLS